MPNASPWAFSFCKLLSVARPRPSAPGRGAAPASSPAGAPSRTALEALTAAAHGALGAARLAAAQ
ncbi:hypothetical protein P7K49_001212, partial [Saguinus oedipus]